MVPIEVPQRPRDPSPAAIDANRRGTMLRAQGRFDEAVDALREACTVFPESAVLHANLATALADARRFDVAMLEYERALSYDPGCAAALNGLGSLHVRAGRFAEARGCHERVLSADNANIAAHQAMYELEQIEGNVRKALDHQRRVLEQKTLFSFHAPNEKRSLLALAAPGDWQANVPVEFLIDRATTTLHMLYVVSPDQMAKAPLPRADIAFVAIGESEVNAPALTLAESYIRRAGLPYLNDPRKVLAANRARVAEMLAPLREVFAPPVTRVSRIDLAGGAHPVSYPIVIRPVGSQAGYQLARVSGVAELQRYVDGSVANEYFVSPFVDFRSADGYYRKYRIIVVDGVPYPYHLAISPNWMIHYYNAPMRETAWMREEEAAFLSGFETVFGPALQHAFREIAIAIGLDYFGIDCSIDPQGRLLVFEADPAMIVHAGDQPELFGYKKPYVERIFHAFEKLIDRARSR